jgi:hypothetical protein
MKDKRLWLTKLIMAVFVLTVGTCVLAQARRPERLTGILSDYTPLNAGASPTGPWEMRGQWSLNIKKDGKADFSAVMDMELSDYWLFHSNSDAGNPTIRSAHTHHITITNVAVTYNPVDCPAESPANTARLEVSGTADFITGNGNPAPFEAKGPSMLQLCITGGSDIEHANMTLVFTGSATGHFGTQAVHGVVRFPHKDVRDRDSDER